MVTVIAPNGPAGSELVKIGRQMRRRGAPTLRAFKVGKVIWAIEGSHRLAACIILGLTPRFQVVPTTNPDKTLPRLDVWSIRGEARTVGDLYEMLMVGCAIQDLSPDRVYRFKEIDLL